MKNATEIIVVLDRSGSMFSIQKDMEDGFTAFLKEQMENKVDEARISLYQFDTDYETLYENMPVGEAPKLVLVPRGATALYDAIGKTINSTGERLSKLSEEDRPQRVVFVIITDGYENASREFSRDKIKDMIEHQTQKYSWNFVFLGANQDSTTTAKGMGIYVSASITFGANHIGVTGCYNSLSNNLVKYRSGSCGQYTFTEKDRAAQTAAGVDPTLNKV